MLLALGLDEKKAGRNASCRTRIYDLCRHLFSEYMKEQAATAADGDIERAFSFIRAHYRENFSTEEIAKYCSVSQSYLRGKFKRMTGTSITRFREGLRIGEAKNMLESGFFSMQEIALHLGYSDVYHFSKRFAAATGTPPATYKKLFYTKK